MAIYKYSTQASGSIAFTTADSFIFDTITAASLGITVSGLDVVITDGTKTFTLTGFDIKKISSTNFTFDDGSKLQIGDGTTATINDDKDNIIIGTEYDDYFDGLGGSDTVSYASATSGVQVNLGTQTAQDTLGAGFDKILNIENIIGSAYNDTLTGTAGNNILNGGAGIDSLTGGDGNDTYIVTAGDTITDTAGTDTVQSSVDYALVDTSLEHLTLLPGAVNGKGNSLANTLTGNTAGNVLDGAGGNDTLKGGAGNDTYIVGSTGDTIIEVAGTTGTDAAKASFNGIDTVISTITIGSLAANVENLRLLGSGSLHGTGNALDNIIYASKGANVLDGLGGTDTVSYRYGATKGVTVSLADTGSQSTVGSSSDTLSNFEKLIGSNYGDKLTAATAVNTLDGGAGNDILTGSGKDDTLIGGAGNDTFVVDAAVATTAVAGSVYGISEAAGAGIDTIKASATVSIVALANIENITLTDSGLTATGNALANTLTSTGFSGSTLVGGAGNDTYVVSSSGETITESSTTGSGTDSVISTATFTLANNVENLTLIGSGDINATGNGLANIIVGNSGANILNGKLGNDKMSGGAGNDTYFVDSSADIVTEVAGTGATEALKANANGIDAVKSTITTTLGANVENLILLSGAINGTGNSLNNTITGSTSANTLDGKLGNDTMIGLAGDDTYIVDSSSDTVTEAASAGTDTVKSSATYIIGDNVENLTLTGSSAINGTGNASDNTLTGNGGNNTLSGAAGADTLIGGAGKDTLTGGADADDTFVYNAASESTVVNFDVITDFTTTSDKIDVSAIFDGTDPTTLLTTAFTGVGSAEVLFTGGKVSFDIDGDANADFAIALTGTSTAPVFGDFIF